MQVPMCVCKTYKLLEDFLRLVIVYAELEVDNSCMGPHSTLDDVSTHHLKKLKSQRILSAFICCR